ncbi:leucine-rich repeat domain-containing protein [Histomonas meleagridis]|uniref:leucine-rich repeat domain-containing protein n=1 Tax=Histomonas meleagridis TaxID=135588 RepID=UPI003559E2E3|nr:leucine-rich repeat domain-containing protein [Histomonas meleagridis]KAH0797588.1 leucine-rich repeat domain-containing protein [Histomonas meleagridis]
MSIITVDLVNFRLNEENMTATVAPSPMASKNIVIPVFVESDGKQYTVIGIEDFAFARTGIKSITFGKGSKVTSFGNGCFSESSLIRLTLPPNLSLVGNMWRSGARMLNEIKVTPANQHYVEENGVLYNKEKTILLNLPKDKTSITLPATLKIIPDDILIQNNSLQSITISPKNEYYSTEAGVLYNKDKTEMILCPKTKISLTLPRTLKKFGELAFRNCGALSSITVAATNNNFCVQHGLLFNHNKTIIYFCERNKTIVKIPNTVEIISPFAFSGCAALESLSFQENSKLQVLQKYSFSHSAIKSVEIPSSVKKIDEGGFASCKNLKILTFQDNSEIEIIDRLAFASTPIDTVKLPSSLKFIGGYTFAGCQGLRSIIFPHNSQLEEIEEGSLAGSAIEEIEIPANVRKIGESVFLNCEKLKTVSFAPDSKLESIGKCSFSIPLLEKIVLPKSLKVIGIGTFADTHKLKSVTFEEGSQLETIEEDGFCCSGIESFDVPEGVSYLGRGAFIECINLHKVVLNHKGTITIERNAFRGVADDFKLVIYSDAILQGEGVPEDEQIEKISQ